MSREKELVKSTAILSLGTFVPKMVAVVVTPILTAQLTKNEYGQYDLIATIVSLLLPAITLQISSAAFRFLIEVRESEEKIKKVVSSIYAFTLPVSLIAVVLYWLYTGNEDQFWIDNLLIGIYFLGDILLITSQQVLRGLGLYFKYSLSTIARSVLDMVLVILLLGGINNINLGLTGVLFAMSMSTIGALTYIIFGVGIWKYIDVKAASSKEIKSLLSYSWPMVPNNLSGWVLRLSDRLVITTALGVEANAVYAVANKLPHLFGAVQNTFIYAWQENASLASKDNDKNTYYTQMCNGVFYILIGIMAALIACTPLMYKLLIKGDYSDAYYQMPVLYIGMLFSCMASVLGGIYIAFKRTKSVGITTMFAACINLLIDVLFVNHIGIWAGSISTMMAYMILLVYRMIDVQKFQKISFSYGRLVIGVLLLAVMAYLSYQREFVFDILNLVLGCIVVLIYERDMMKVIFSVIIKKMKRRHA